MQSRLRCIHIHSLRGGGTKFISPKFFEIFPNCCSCMNQDGAKYSDHSPLVRAPVVTFVFFTISAELTLNDTINTRPMAKIPWEFIFRWWCIVRDHTHWILQNNNCSNWHTAWTLYTGWLRNRYRQCCLNLWMHLDYIYIDWDQPCVLFAINEWYHLLYMQCT